MHEQPFTVEPITTEEALMDQMTAPTPEVEQVVADLGGEVMILGAGGKMGPTIAQLLVRAGVETVIGVDLFHHPGTREHLDAVGVHTVQCDLLDDQALLSLPKVRHIILAAGFKFGATGNESPVWAMNVLLPATILQHFQRSRIIYVSSGNVYPFVSVTGSGSTENDPVAPVGEYAQSRLGGERLVQFLSERNGTPVTIVRLNYATELRYGVIHDIVTKVKNRVPIDLVMGHFNQIWQGDAVAYLVRSFSLCQSPPKLINLTAPGILTVRAVAARAGPLMGIEPILEGVEEQTALLADPSQIVQLMGPPKVEPDTIIQWVTWWVMHGGASLGKPTKYERRDGKY